ncbi:MAG TPA: ABC transporter substrate-binding protein [Epulopiscium sp.]|nr:ABC transporter substrate-binding protein [Candidatus Epulonipiscium sp.]
MKLKRLFGISLLALTVVTGCSGGTASDDKSAETIKIGTSFALTGDVASFGKAARNGVILAAQEYNGKGGILGRQIELFVEDNKGDELEATNAFRKLLDKEEIIAFIGSDISSTTEAIAKIASEEKIPMMAPTATKLGITALGENIFRACYVDPYQGKVIADFAAQDLKGKTAAIMMNNGDDYSIGIAEAFKESFQSQGGAVLNMESYTDQDKDFKPLLLNIKANKPDIILITDYYGTVSLIAQQIKEVGIDAVLIGPDGWDGVAEQIKHDTSVLEGAFFINHYATDDPDPMVKSFVEDYRKEFEEEPNALSVLAYDGAKVLFDAMIKAGTTDYEQVIAEMQASNVKGITGTITYGPDRNPVKSVTIIQIKDGKNTMFKKMDPQ